ncbi:MAG: ATP-binding protein [Planctomycetota bacterium]
MGLLNRIRTKLLLAFVAVTVLPVAAVSVYSSRAAAGALRDSAIRATQEAVELAAERLDLILYFSNLATEFAWRNRAFWPRALIALGVERPESGRAVEEETKNFEQGVFVPLLRDTFGWKSMTLMKPDFGEVIRVQKDETGCVTAARDLSTGPPVLKERPLDPRGVNVFFWRDLDGTLLCSFVGVLRETVSSPPVGFLAIDVSLEKLVGEGFGAPGESDTKLFLVGSRGASVFSPELGLEAPELTDTEKATCLSGGSGALLSARNTILAYADVDPHFITGAKWYLLRETPAEKVLASVAEFRLVFVLLLAGSLLAALALAMMFARHITRPLMELRDGARVIAEGNLLHRITPRVRDEVGQLAHEFNAMASKLKEVYDGMERTIEQKTAALREAYAELQRDFEERKQLESQLIQAEKLSSIGTLASSIAHEINNPIGIISMYAQMLEEKARRGEVDLDKLALILEQAKRVAGITRNLLDFARGRPPEIAPMSLREIITSTISLVHYKLERGGIRTEVRLPADLPEIRGDPGQLSQVVLNLILNAEQAMNGGGKLTVSGRLLGASMALEGVPESVGRGPFVEVSFSDTGHGISDDNLARLFEPFFTTKSRGVGTGLGLAVSRGIVRSHGGTILVESELGKGATFRVILPVQGPAPERAERLASPSLATEGES